MGIRIYLKLKTDFEYIEKFCSKPSYYSDMFMVDLQISKDLCFSFDLLNKFTTTEPYFKNYILVKYRTFQYY